MKACHCTSISDAEHLFLIDLNARRGPPAATGDLVFGSRDLLQAFSTVDLLESGALGGGSTYDGDRHRDFSRCAPQRYAVEHLTGVA